MSHEWERSGEEWKRGSEYEGPEERALREVGEAIQAVGRSIEQLARVMDGVSRSFLREATRREGVHQLRRLGWSEADAKDEMAGLFIQCQAEGTNYARAVKATIARAVRRTG